MYCPNCGSNNQAEIKFCTRCGTNLNLVSEALSAKLAARPKGDDRLAKALKDYYLSRRATLIGGLTLPAGLTLLMAWSAMGFPETFAVIALIGLALAIYGAIYAIWGIEHWISSASEIKALKTVDPQIPLSASSQEQAGRAVPQLAESVVQYSTDPIEPRSVTEHTTHFLEEANQAPSSQPRVKEHH